MENLKQCTKCKKILNKNNFVKRTLSVDGLAPKCRNCVKKYKKQYYMERGKIMTNKWRKNNPNKVKKYKRKYYQTHKNTTIKKYEEKNKEIIKQNRIKYYKEHKSELDKKFKIYYSKNYHKIYTPQKRESQRLYTLKKYREDPHYKLKNNIHCLINQRLKKRLISKNGKSTFNFVSWTIDELYNHLESLFEPWMNWNNRGLGKNFWNIDHIIPDNYFNYKSTKDKEFQAYWSLENLRPLNSITNMIKGKRLDFDEKQKETLEILNKKFDLNL